MLRKATAARYARALFEAALEAGVAEKVASELESFSRLVESVPALGETLHTPALPVSVRRRVLLEILDRAGAERLTRNFLGLVVDRNRINLLPEMVRAYLDVLDEHMGVVSVEVMAASELEPEEQERLRRRLERLTERRVKMQIAVDPELIGGLVVKINSTVYDGSIKRQLQEFKRRIVLAE